MYKNLDVWKYSFDFVKEIYKATLSFPADEKFGLTSQLRRAAVSLPANIAEGAGRKSTKEFIRFLSIALGSVSELDTLLLLSKDLKFIEGETVTELLDRLNIIGKLIYGLMKSLGYKSEF
ncbi:four helix bundle protein [Panacibacter ginsenosidivorans]|uniref:Four helix bundle protein n=1 Tax=Panacibacter ginsenosidivorans TaxID=1813871 RepID=A0A5B8V6Q1_9BACT|nr:four helix bundle protein [Panacibacter ginsenosidivorans]QEC66326.1 four helix bundle protein [Panacibacter ginsenosidivorans]